VIRQRPATARSLVIPFLIALLAAGGLLLAGPADPRPGTGASVLGADVCGKRYVAVGDHVPAGHEVGEDERYPEQLISKHLGAYGYCVYNKAVNETTSSTYLSEGQLAQTWNLRPDLITLTVGGENTSIVNAITSCFDKVRDHDFLGANICAAMVLADAGAWSQLQSDLTTALQQYRLIMSGRPNLVVALVGYANPYPSALDAGIGIPLLCIPLVDTIPTCTVRWVQLPPALAMLDRAIKQLNGTMQAAIRPFQQGPSGNRYVFVDIYEKFRDHCMKMDVEIKTTVEHPEQSGAVHDHNSSHDFGCDDPWFVEGDDGTAIPFYLIPAAPGVLVKQSQTTEGMGVHPDADGQACIADLIWEADTIDPGTTPLKWKLGVPERPDSDICD
jgi:hypothetical protein